jgi:aspartokinase-like uncharacterized kinase
VSAHTGDITVLKVGGSLAESGGAARLMQALAVRRPPRLLIVPGGGEFADAVRAAQARVDFSDRAAHHMALLAMHACAVMLADLAEGFTLADQPAQFEAAWSRAATPIWLPAPMVLASDLPASWDVTSDSLAAWIAVRVGAARLILVKSCLLFEEPECDAAKLAAEGIVDAGFANMVRNRRVRWKVVSGVDGALRVLWPELHRRDQTPR